MKPHSYAKKQWGNTAFDNNNIAYDSRIVNAPLGITAYSLVCFPLRIMAKKKSGTFGQGAGKAQQSGANRDAFIFPKIPLFSPVYISDYQSPIQAYDVRF
jgi:hypothetical protein